MKRLILLRHGTAVERGTDGIPEDERPLTPKGERQILRAAVAIRRLVRRIDLIVSSPLTRATQTADILAEGLKRRPRVVHSEILRPETGPAQIAEWIGHLEDPRVVLVGHNPNLSELLRFLLTGSGEPTASGVELRKGGLASFRYDTNGPELTWLATPNLVRALLE